METNHAYLAGCLKGKLISLVFDTKFPTDYREREEYIKNIIEDAEAQEKEYTRKKEEANKPMRVRCINVEGLGTHDELEIGGIYTVAYHNHNGCYYNLKEAYHPDAWYYTDRFEVVED